MKIAVLAPYLPYPPHAGGCIRMLELLRFLHKRHEVTLATFVRLQELPFIDIVATYCTRLIPVVRRKKPATQNKTHPFRIADFWDPGMYDTVESLNRKHSFDIVDVQHIFMAQYAHLIAAPAVLHEHNIESQVLKRYTHLPIYYDNIHTLTRSHPSSIHFREAQTEWSKMADYESVEWPKFPLRITVSEFDRLEMVKRCPAGQVVTIPNGVNTETFPFVGSSEKANVLFIGALDYQPNVDAAFELCEVIWPLVQRYVPQSCLYIIGRNAPSELLARSRQGCIEVLSDVQDIVPYAADCCLSVVPLRIGGGTRIKILTAMALGLPVVSTPIGYEGLDLIPGKDLLVADTPEDFAQRIVDLLLYKAKRTALSQNGRALVEAHYDWQHIFLRLEQLYEEIVEQSSKPVS